MLWVLHLVSRSQEEPWRIIESQTPTQSWLNSMWHPRQAPTPTRRPSLQTRMRRSPDCPAVESGGGGGIGCLGIISMEPDGCSPCLTAIEESHSPPHTHTHTRQLPLVSPDHSRSIVPQHNYTHLSKLTGHNCCHPHGSEPGGRSDASTSSTLL